MAPTNSIRVYGHISGQFVVGDHNVVVNASGDSRVDVRTEPSPRVRLRRPPVGRSALPRPSGLLGRETELADLVRWLGDRRPVHVYGAPGIGKTALLAEYAARSAGAGRDVVYFSAAGLPVQDVVQELFDACYVTDDADGYKPEPDRLRRLMGSVGALLVVDDFDGSAADLTVLVDAAPSCDVLLASAGTVSGGAWQGLRLAGLTEEDGLALLGRELGRPPGADEAAARRLVATVRGHPLALVQAAAALRLGGSATGFAAEESALAFGIAGELSAGAGRLLGLLCGFAPLAVSFEVLGACSGTGPAPAGADLVELAAAGLLTQDGFGYRASGPLGSRVAERAGTLRRPAELVAPLTAWVGAAGRPHQVVTETAVVLLVLAAAERAGDDAGVCRLARTVAPVLAGSLHWGAWQRVLEFGARAARRLGAGEDAAYFSREDDTRRRALGLVSGLALGGGMSTVLVTGGAAGNAGGGTAATTTAQSGSGTGSGSGTSGTLLGSVAAHPAVIAALAAAIVVGGTLTGLSVTANEPPRDPPSGSVSTTGTPTTGSTPPPTPTDIGSSPPPTPTPATEHPTRSPTWSPTRNPTPPPKPSLPAAPSGAKAEAIDRYTILLTWLDNAGDETAYEVGNGNTTRTLPPNTTTYRWGNLKPGQYICLRVRAVNRAGASSYAPAQAPYYVCATTPGRRTPTIPATPSGVVVEALNSTTARVTWTDNSGDETAFWVNNGDTTRSAPPNKTSYDWDGLVSGKYMCFRVSAVNGAGASPYAPTRSPYYVCTTTP
ncbi:hypothetical protein [Streptomyces sp. NPDC054863]